MATIASGLTSYAAATDILARFDLRPLAQLLSDSGSPLEYSPAGIAASTALTAILQEASGVLEAAALVGQRYNITAAAPPTPGAPSLSTATLGGTVAAGTYQGEVTYQNNVGETLASVATSLTTTGSTSTLTCASPPNIAIATGWNFYLTQVGGSTFTRQNTSLLVLGVPFILTAPPTSSGSAPPTAVPVTQNDLQAIATSGTNTAAFLIGIVSSIAYMMIWERRPEWLGSDPEKSNWRVKMAMDCLDKLRDGVWIFGTVESGAAGEMNDTVETEQVLMQQNRITRVSRPLFGPRVADIVGSNPPPTTYP